MFDSIVQSLEHVANNPSEWSRDSVIDAVSLTKSILDFEFINALHVVERYMSYTESLMRSLQSRALDIIQAVQHISTLKQVLSDARSNIDQQFHAIHLNAKRRADKFGVTVVAPRRCSRQIVRENHPGDTTEEYYRRYLAIPFLDHLKSETDGRFTSHAVLAMKCLSIIPSCFSCGVTNDDEVLKFFSSDIDYLSTARAELQLWCSHFKDREPLPDTPELSLKHATPMLFPNISLPFRIQNTKWTIKDYPFCILKGKCIFIIYICHSMNTKLHSRIECNFVFRFH